MVVLAYYPLGETRVQREAEALVAHGYEVDVLCLRGRDESPEAVHQGVSIHRLPLRIKKSSLFKQFLNYLQFFILAAIAVTRLHWKHAYSSIQVHNLPDFLVFCTLLPKLNGVPVILDLHDLMPEFYVGRFGVSKGGWLSALVRWQERQACKFADHVITVSEHWRQALIQRGVPANKCSVVMNVADERIFTPGPARDRPRMDQSFRMIYHGSVVYRYGLDLAIQAVNVVKDEIPGIHLTILGDGDAIPDLIKMTETLGLQDHVAIYDELRPAEELPEIIRAADLGVVPYRNDVFTDGLLPTKLMEYAAMGLPSIASRTTAMERYFSDTMAEFFLPGDADGLARCIRLLYTSPQRMTELKAGCAVFNERYNWKKISAEYAALVAGLHS
jgi:glycosyltransferase involved in cell wall biosynthesis